MYRLLLCEKLYHQWPYRPCSVSAEITAWALVKGERPMGFPAGAEQEPVLPAGAVGSALRWVSVRTMKKAVFLSTVSKAMAKLFVR